MQSENRIEELQFVDVCVCLLKGIRPFHMHTLVLLAWVTTLQNVKVLKKKNIGLEKLASQTQIQCNSRTAK